MATERKKYWQDGKKFLCETSYYHADTDNVSTAFVNEVSAEEFNAATARAIPQPVMVEGPQPDFARAHAPTTADTHKPTFAETHKPVVDTHKPTGTDDPRTPFVDESRSFTNTPTPEKGKK